MRFFRKMARKKGKKKKGKKMFKKGKNGQNT